MTARSLFLCVALLIGSQHAFAAAPSNDRVNHATTVSSLPFQDVLNTSAATTSMNDPVCVGQGPTVWFRYRASQDGPVTANTFGSDYDTTLSVYTFTPGRMLTQIACNDDYESLEFLRVLPGKRGRHVLRDGGRLRQRPRRTTDVLGRGLTRATCTERANRHHIRLARCEWPSVSCRDRDLLWLQQWVRLWKRHTEARKRRGPSLLRRGGRLWRWNRSLAHHFWFSDPGQQGKVQRGCRLPAQRSRRRVCARMDVE